MRFGVSLDLLFDARGFSCLFFLEEGRIVEDACMRKEICHL